MKIFVSSTCYDLRDLRAEVEQFLKDKGHEVLMSDRPDFPINVETHRHDVCIENVNKCDLYLLVIDSRFGAEYYKDNSISITWAEFREALKGKKIILAFVRKDVFNERNFFKGLKKEFEKNLSSFQGNSILSSQDKNDIISLLKPSHTDDERTFGFIDEIQKHKKGMWLSFFDNSIDVKTCLNNLYKTNNSPLNQNPTELKVNSLSAQTIEYLEEHITNKKSTITFNTFDLNLLKKASKEIEEQNVKSDELKQNDLFYYFPINDNEFKIIPTALGKSIKNEIDSAIKKIERNNSLNAIFTDVVKRKPLFCRGFEFEGISYILGFYEKNQIQRLCVLKSFANTWTNYHDIELDAFMCFPKITENFEIIIENENCFFYFERLIQHMGTMNRGFGVAEFNLFELKTKVIHKLLYQGKYRRINEEIGLFGIEGNFNFDDLDSKEEKFIKILENLASKSELIYRTPENFDLDAPENYIEKWQIENPDFYNNLEGIIDFYFYDESILWKEAIFDNQYTGFIENDFFEIYYYFAGPVLAFRKSDKKYFVILVPSGYGLGGMWGLRSFRNIRFTSDNEVFIMDGMIEFKINLEDGRYSRGSYQMDI